MSSLLNRSTTDLKSQERNQKLLQALRNEQSNVSMIAEAFYDMESPDVDEYNKVCNKIITLVDRISESADWSDSLFLRNTLKPLLKLRDDCLGIIAALDENDTGKKVQPLKVAANNELVYITVFQNNGQNLNQWELQLHSIERYLAGRPVYKSEEDAAKAIRLKGSQQSEAYIVVEVPGDQVQDSVEARQDKYGHKLVTLSQGAVTSDSIVEFVHGEQRYRYQQGKLIPVQL